MPALSFYIATALCAGGIVATMALPPLETIEAKASAAAMKAGDHGGRYDTIDSPTIRYRRSDGPGVHRGLALSRHPRRPRPSQDLYRRR